MFQRHELEKTNRKLQSDLDLARMEMNKLRHEIEMLKQRYQVRAHKQDGLSSPEYYL